MFINSVPLPVPLPAALPLTFPCLLPDSFGGKKKKKKKPFCSPRTLGSGEKLPPANSALPGRRACHITPCPASPRPPARHSCLLLPAFPILTKQHEGAALAGGHKAGSRRLGWSSGAPALASPAWFYDDSSSPKADGISCALLLGQMQSHGGEGKELRTGTAAAPATHRQRPPYKGHGAFRKSWGSSSIPGPSTPEAWR